MSNAVNLTPETITVLKQQMVQAIKDEGLVLLPKAAARFANGFYEQRKKILQQDTVTPYAIVKYELIPGVTTIKTVKNMIKDNRIHHTEHYRDENNKIQILTETIKRLNK